MQTKIMRKSQFMKSVDRGLLKMEEESKETHRSKNESSLANQAQDKHTADQDTSQNYSHFFELYQKDSKASTTEADNTLMNMTMQTGSKNQTVDLEKLHVTDQISERPEETESQESQKVNLQFEM